MKTLEDLARDAGISVLTTIGGSHETAANFAQLARVAALVRAQALDEAAAVCDKESARRWHGGERHESAAIDMAIEEIRALKEST